MVDVTQASSVTLERQGKLPILGVFATTFRTFGRAPLTFLVLALITQVPVMARLLINAPTTPKFTWSSAIVIVVNLLILFFIQTAMTYVAVRTADNQPAPLGEAFSLGARRYLPMLGTTLLTLLAVYGGLILFIVPGLIWACMFAVAAPACALEGTGPVTSMKRSSSLTRFSRWRVLGVYLLFFIPLMIISVLVSFLIARRGEFLLSQWISVGIQLFWVPLATIFSAAIYVELRRLKENVGISRVFD